MKTPTPFDPRREAELLSAYVDGELPPEDVARVEAHLALPEAESGWARREIEQLRGLNRLTENLRLKEPPAEEWEVFWTNFYNRAERSLGWLLFGLGAAVLGGWGVLRAVLALLGDAALPLYVKGGVFVAAAGLLLLTVSALRERLYKRRHTRYKDVIR